MRVNISVYPQQNWIYVAELVTKETGPSSSQTTQRPILDSRSEEFKAMHGRARWLKAQKMGVYSQEWDLDESEIEEAILFTIFRDPGELPSG